MNSVVAYKVGHSFYNYCICS